MRNLHISNATVGRERSERYTVGLPIESPVRVFKAELTNKLIYAQYGCAEVWPWESASQHYMCGAESAPYGVGIFYSQAKSGRLFIAGDSTHKVEAEDIQSFKKTVLKGFGIDLK